MLFSPLVSFFVKKLLHVVIVLFGTALITFLLAHAIPGNPWSNYSSTPRIMMGMSIDRATVQELSRRFGLDLPLWRQFTRYLVGDFNEQGAFFCGVVCGNFGPSIQHGGRSVQDVLFKPAGELSFWESRFGYSLRLVLLGAMIAVFIGIPLGILSAVRQSSPVDQAISVGLATFNSIPNFVLGLLAVVLLGGWLHLISILPNWKSFGDWIIPAVVLSLMPMASIARVTRASLIHVMGEDYIRTARAKGLTQARVIAVHVLRVGLVPILTYLGPTLMEMFTGLFIVENMFSFPGIGREYWESVIQLDYPMIFGLTLVYATGIVLVNLSNEVLAALLDPRIRSARQAAHP